MFSLPDNISIFLYGLPIDLRYGFEGLSGAASQLFPSTPSEAYFVFINKRRTRMKVLHKGLDNLSLWYIQSRKGVFFPNRKMISSIITRHEFGMLLNGQPPNYLIVAESVL